MTTSDWLETFGLLLVMASPFTIGLIASSMGDRRKREGRETKTRPMSPTEFYALRHYQKRDTVRRLRATARQHRRPTSQHYNNDTRR